MSAHGTGWLRPLSNEQRAVLRKAAEGGGVVQLPRREPRGAGTASLTTFRSLKTRGLARITRLNLGWFRVELTEAGRAAVEQLGAAL